MLRGLFIGLIVVFTASSGFADDYLLRLEIRGFDFLSTPKTEDEKPEETVRETYETNIREDVPFRIRVLQGKRTVLIEGTLNKTERGPLSCSLNFADILDTGNVVLVEAEKTKPVEEITSIRTVVSVKLGEPTTIGELETKKSEIHPDGTTHFHWRRHQHILTIEERVGASQLEEKK